jgi:hypothetical protein
MTLRSLAGTALLLTAIAVAARFALADVDAAPVQPPSSPAATPRIEAPPAPVESATVSVGAPAATPAAAPAAAGGSIRFPDGSSKPALNGVTEALELPWPADRPFAAVLDVVSHAGTDFYRHADGTFSTTVVRTESVSGKQVQIGLCYSPSPADSVGHAFAAK